MKKFCKIIIVFLIIINIYCNAFCVRAQGIWEIGNKFLNLGSQSSAALNKYNTSKTIVAFIGIIDFLWGLGLLVILISTVVLGIKYMIVSPNEKSRIKQATTPYIIGVIIIFGAVTIWKFIIVLLEGSMLGK